MKNTTPWLLWLMLMTITLLSTRNPFYLLGIVTLLLLLGSMLSKRKHYSSWLGQNLRFLVTMVLLSTLINTLFTHTGRTVLFTLPENWLLIGGDITAESLVYGAINGLVIGSLYLVFNIINLALSIKQLTHLIPAAFRPIGVMVTISLTFFPSVQQRAREIKEAQMIRGNAMKNISDWLPLLLPLLVTSLENAFLLAESMTARGFYIPKKTIPADLTILGVLLATFAVFSGWILSLYNYPSIVSLILYGFASAIIILIFLIASKRSKVTRYHQETWHSGDILALILLSMIALGWLIINLNGSFTSLSYSPYPVLTFPKLQLAGLIFLAIPLMPILVNNHD